MGNRRVLALIVITRLLVEIMATYKVWEWR